MTYTQAFIAGYADGLWPPQYITDVDQLFYNYGKEFRIQNRHLIQYKIMDDNGVVRDLNHILLYIKQSETNGIPLEAIILTLDTIIQATQKNVDDHIQLEPYLNPYYRLAPKAYDEWLQMINTKPEDRDD